jgi:hypothetical protein
LTGKTLHEVSGRYRSLECDDTSPQSSRVF